MSSNIFCHPTGNHYDTLEFELWVCLGYHRRFVVTICLFFSRVNSRAFIPFIDVSIFFPTSFASQIHQLRHRLQCSAETGRVQKEYAPGETQGQHSCLCHLSLSYSLCHILMLFTCHEWRACQFLHGTIDVSTG